MAAVTERRDPGRLPVQVGGQIADPRGILVSLAPGSAAADVPPLLLAPVDAPGHVLVNGAAMAATLTALDEERAILVRVDGQPRRTTIVLLPLAMGGGAARGVASREVIVDGWRVEVEVEPAVRAALRERARRGREEIGESGPTEVRAIIPGVVVSVAVTAGDAVSAGQQLLVVEAMKMQNELRAPRDGSIERVAVASGAKVEVGDLLLVLT